MTTSVVMEMNLGENVKQSVNGGGRRKSKSSELTQKKKQPQRGMGVAQLERLRLQERWKKMTEIPSLPHLHLQNQNHRHVFPPSAPFAAAQNGAVQFRPATAPYPGHGNGLFSSSDYPFQNMDPSVIGSGFHVENSKELSSIPNYLKCASDRCGICPKKKRINGESWGYNGQKNMYADISSSNPFDDFKGNNYNNGGNQFLAAKARGSSGQSTGVTVYDFFPSRENCAASSSSSASWDYKEFMKMGLSRECGGSSSSSSSFSVAGLLGLRGGEGCCVTGAAAETDSTGGLKEEGANNISVDLSLKLSY